MSDSDGDSTVGTETAGEIVNHAILAVICVLLTSIFGFQFAATLKKDSLVRTLKRVHGVTHIPHASIYAAAGSQVRLFHLCGLVVVLLVDIRALDPLGRLFIPSSWMRLVNWNAIAALIVVFTITLELNLRLLVLLKRNTFHRFARYFFRAFAVITVVVTEVSFGFYISVDPSNSGKATIAFHAILIFIIITTVTLWDIIVVNVRLTVKDTIFSSSSKASQSNPTLVPIAEAAPTAPTSALSLPNSPHMSSEFGSDPQLSTESHGPGRPQSPEPIRSDVDSVSLDIHQNESQATRPVSSTELEPGPLLARTATHTRTVISVQSSTDQTSDGRNRGVSRTAKPRDKERAVVSALRKMMSLTIGVHVVLVFAFAYGGYVIFVSSKADTRARFTIVDMANAYVLLAIASLALWYSWKSASWHIVTTPMPELIALVKQGTTVKPKKEALSGAGSGRPERPSQEMALRSPTGPGVKSKSSHAEDESDPNDYTNSGTG